MKNQNDDKPVLKHNDSVEKIENMCARKLIRRNAKTNLLDKMAQGVTDIHSLGEQKVKRTSNDAGGLSGLVKSKLKSKLKKIPGATSNPLPPKASSIMTSASAASAKKIDAINMSKLQDMIGEFIRDNQLSSGQIELLANYMNIEVGGAILDDVERMYNELPDGTRILKLSDPAHPETLNSSTTQMVSANGAIDRVIMSHPQTEQFFQAYENSSLSQALQSHIQSELSGKVGMERMMAQGEISMNVSEAIVSFKQSFKFGN